MNVLIVYDSFFGNTEQVAQAMGQALFHQAEVQTLRVGDVRPEHLSQLDALVVGSPTRAFSPTPAVKKWLSSLPSKSLSDVKVAAFDTRMDVKEVNSRVLNFFVGFFGYAAEPMAARLVKKGGTRAMPPAGFFVEGTEGPLRDGELERAAQWVQQIVPTQ
ncbi:MAG TPA: flavodoxin family protein [Chloroflexi bacterium]|nr:flavodoxin family protein [Chloroflexota bacterium]